MIMIKVYNQTKKQRNYSEETQCHGSWGQSKHIWLVPYY
jgi:hypothetical protein